MIDFAGGFGGWVDEVPSSPWLLVPLAIVEAEVTYSDRKASTIESKPYRLCDTTLGGKEHIKMHLGSLYLNNDNVLVVDKYRDAVDDGFVNDATLSFLVRDEDGDVVQDSSDMRYVEDSDGRYTGVISANSLDFEVGAIYEVTIVDLNGGSDPVYEERVKMRCKNRVVPL